MTEACLLPEGRFEGREAFTGLVRQVFAVAAAQRWKQLVVCDPDFDDWPLGEAVVASSLNDWARGGGRLVMLAARYDMVARKHHRFVHWRGTWAHQIECRRLPGLDGGGSLMLAPVWVAERLDTERSTGICSHHAARRVAVQERVAGWLPRSSPAFPATILGL
ncbi:MAG: hypothetical protein V4731_07040 [Pseudomonadota bacterium]